jgi:hypothetical protein
MNWAEFIKYAGFILTSIVALIVAINFIKDWSRIKFVDSFSKGSSGGQTLITGLGVTVIYRGSRSKYIQNLGIAFKDEERTFFNPGWVLSEGSPFKRTFDFPEELKNSEITNTLLSGRYVYFFNTETGERNWSCNPIEMYIKIGRFN